MANPVLPSYVTDRNHMSYPEGNVVESDEEWRKCGKWMIIRRKWDLDFVDRAWSALHPLVRDGTLLLIKASTLRKSDEGSAVLCFTRPGREVARRAAKAIRRVFDHPALMYYKQNAKTLAGMDHRFGNKNVTIYMHTYGGQFYVYDGHWILAEEEARGRNPREPRFYQLILGSDEKLSSRNDQRVGAAEGSNWYLRCSFKEEEDGRPSEADRVWAVARQLYEESVVKAIVFENQGHFAEFRLYVAEWSSLHPCTNLCDRVFDEAAAKSIMYFMEEGDKKHSYRYTQEGELYNWQGDFVMQRQ